MLATPFYRSSVRWAKVGIEKMLAQAVEVVGASIG